MGRSRGGAVMSRDRQAVGWVGPNAPWLDGSSPHRGRQEIARHFNAWTLGPCERRVPPGTAQTRRLRESRCPSRLRSAVPDGTWELGVVFVPAIKRNARQA